MDTKLTLNIDEEVIAKGKIYAKQQKKSLSSLIEQYLKSLYSNNIFDSDSDFEIGQITSELYNWKNKWNLFF